MNKRILNFLMVLVGCGAITGSCKKEDSGVPFTYTSQVVVATDGSLDTPPASSSVNSDKYSIVLMFSTDNGATYTEYPKVSPGQKYKVKLYYGAGAEDLNTSIDKKTYHVGSAMTFDWSKSNPKPIGSATGEVAEFTLAGANNIVVNVGDQHCATDLTEFADGSPWQGDEGSVGHYVNGVKSGANFAGSVDLSQFTVDGGVANRLWMTNVFGDGQSVIAYMDLTTSTKYTDQLVTIPSQVTSEGGTFEGSGTYDQCRQRLVLDVTYTFGADAYKWKYIFTKGPVCAYDASYWTGSWTGAEGTNTRSCGANFSGSNDATTITADGGIANRFHMDNFWGDGVDAYFDFNPATAYWDQTITLPAQVTSEGGSIAASTGTFDSCTGTFKLVCHYTIGGCTYNWTYNFTKN